MALAQELAANFLIGLATPVTAVCVLPLYPGFLSYLASSIEGEGTRTRFLELGALVVAGVMTFMLSIGVLFAFVLQRSLSNVIEVVSPFAFGVLALVSVFLLLDIDLPFGSGIQIPRLEHPRLEALFFGLFFGAVVIPCNPALITFFLARSFLLEAPATKLLSFAAFGLGIGTPLLVLSAVSSAKARKVTSLLTENSSLIHRGSGAVMLAVSLYYLVRVFGVVPWI